MKILAINKYTTKKIKPIYERDKNSVIRYRVTEYLKLLWTNQTENEAIYGSLSRGYATNTPSCSQLVNDLILVLVMPIPFQ
jgi:hypothetical protein